MFVWFLTDKLHTTAVYASNLAFKLKNNTEQNMTYISHKQYRKLHGYLMQLATSCQRLLNHGWVYLPKRFSCRAWLTFRCRIVCLTFPSLSSFSRRGSLWGGGTNHRGCTLMTTPTAMRPVPVRSAHMAQGTAASPITFGRRRMWRRSWTTAPAPTGQRGRRACWACRISSRAKEYWGGIGLMCLG